MLIAYVFLIIILSFRRFLYVKLTIWKILGMRSKMSLDFLTNGGRKTSAMDIFSLIILLVIPIFIKQISLWFDLVICILWFFIIPKIAFYSVAKEWNKMSPDMTFKEYFQFQKKEAKFQKLLRKL